MIEKHACSATCPCQQGRDLAMAEKVLANFATKQLVERVAHRYLRALGMGQGTFTKNLKIHHFRGSLEVTDMTNAGKRGKKVRIMSVIPTSHNDEESSEELLQPLIDRMVHMTYDQVKSHLAEILAETKDLPTPPFNVHEHEVRGIDVEPMGTTINLSKTFPDGSIVEITASPHDFRVKSSTPINAPDKPAHGLHQDTSYWSRGKQSGIIFYGWLKDNMSKASNMTIIDLMTLWHQLGVKFDSH